MRTAYSPKTHTELASASVGTAYGHVPGHQYRDVDVVISHRPGKEMIRCHVVESWGSAQGYDEEHGRREVVGRALSIREACSEAQAAARAAGIGDEYLIPALTQAMDAAEEKWSDEPQLAYYTCEGLVRGGCGHKHGDYGAAEKCLARDQHGCASQGGYSDRSIVAVDSDGSRRMPTEDEAGV